MESEELENVPLVRMEDVQPDRTIEYVPGSQDVFETCFINGECARGGEDTNIGSMVSIKSEEDDYFGECGSEDIKIESDFINIQQVNQESETETQKIEIPSRIVSELPQTQHWPTLEILPGGVINLYDKNGHNLKMEQENDHNLKMEQQNDHNLKMKQQNDHNSEMEEKNDHILKMEQKNNSLKKEQKNYNIKKERRNVHRKAKQIECKEMTYACAKCPETFKYLFCLVKHVKWHEEQRIEEKSMDSYFSKMTPMEKKIFELNKNNLTKADKKRISNVKSLSKHNNGKINVLRKGDAVIKAMFTKGRIGTKIS